MIKQISAAMLVLAVAFPSLADVLQVRKDAPKEYVVKKGDTLWDISSIYLEQPWLWPKLWRLNPQIDNPHLIYPGDKLSLTYDADGNPVLVKNNKYKKLSPYARKTLKQGAIPTVSLGLIRPFLTYEQALEQADIDSFPVVLGADEEVKNLSLNHIAYIKGNLERGRSYGIYRQGNPYIDPETNEELAQEAVLVATGRAFRTGDVDKGIPASLRIKSTTQEIRQGDFVIPAFEGQNLPAFFSLDRPKQAVDGRIIASTIKLREVSKLDVVVLNKGKNSALKPGYMLDIFRQSPKVIEGKAGPRYESDATAYDRLVSSLSEAIDSEPNKDTQVWNMPKEKVGELMIFKVYDNVSYALVTDTVKPIRVGDHIQALP